MFLCSFQAAWFRAAALIRALDAFEVLMILPMFGFVLALLVIGGLASLVAVGDPHHSRLATFIGFTSFFAGSGALLLSFGLSLSLEYVLGSEWWSGLGFFGGYALGLLGGAAFGFRRAFARRRRIETAHE
jgi:hypothetical protein